MLAATIWLANICAGRLPSSLVGCSMSWVAVSCVSGSGNLGRGLSECITVLHADGGTKWRDQLVLVKQFNKLTILSRLQYVLEIKIRKVTPRSDEESRGLRHNVWSLDDAAKTVQPAWCRGGYEKEEGRGHISNSLISTWSYDPVWIVVSSIFETAQLMKNNFDAYS
jgi:hypothetical protein